MDTANTLYVLRGLPGSGKDFYILNNFHPASIVVCSADDYMMVDGKYEFSPMKLGPAHAASQCKALTAMAEGVQQVVVNNTNTTAWEYSPYLAAANALGYKVEIIDLFDGGCTDAELAARNVHDVPVGNIARMRSRYER